MEFRERFKNNPREVLMEESGEAIPENIKIAVVDFDEVDLFIPLPATEKEELSDDELDGVSGGFVGTTFEIGRGILQGLIKGAFNDLRR